ncbi:MAG: carboxypeptidase regulatory-like domain-containing protein, partial [Acidobacteria bacterium]|nr:carboxypeptidase regulatory-like domain-containing protein [Acidobacteriota bacterium]
MKIRRIIVALAGLLMSAIVVSANFAVWSGVIKGTVRATSGSRSTLIAGAKLTLTNKAASGKPYNIETNKAGEFIFPDLPAGSYILLVQSKGLTSVSREIKLDSGAVLTVNIDLAVTVGETVEVTIEEGLLSTSETSVSNVIRAETLKIEPFRDDNFQNSIALTPGVVRDGKNNNFLKGTRTGQSGYKVNGADVTDPISGNVAFEIPLEAASTVEVEENPYSAEYGQFTGAVTNLNTKGGGEKFKFSAARLFPTFSGIISSKVESFRPRITFSGPIIKENLYFLQSFE